MSLSDIKESFSTIKILNKEYKICYRHRQIAEMQSYFNDKDIIEICAMLMNNEPVSIIQRLNFCLIGFKKYHPEITLDDIDEADNYFELFDICRNEFLSRNLQPDIYKKLAISDENVKKKIKNQRQNLAGRIVSALRNI